MALIALSASYGAGGSRVGPGLAEQFGVPFLDRAIPMAVAERLDVRFDDAVANDENVAPSWLERMLSSFVAIDTGAPTLVVDATALPLEDVTAMIAAAFSARARLSTR